MVHSHFAGGSATLGLRSGAGSRVGPSLFVRHESLGHRDLSWKGAPAELGRLLGRLRTAKKETIEMAPVLDELKRALRIAVR